jgi:hypothetical protein
MSRSDRPPRRRPVRQDMIFSGGLHLDEVAGLGCGLGEYAVVDGEEGELEPVGDASLVVDGTQVVFDDLLFGSELRRNLLVLAALNDQGDDLHLFWSQAVANAGPDAVRGLHGGDVDGLHEALSTTYAANTVHQIGSGDVAAEDAVEEDGDLVGNVLGVLGDEDETATEGFGPGQKRFYVRMQAGGDHYDGAAEAIYGAEELWQIFALSGDAHIVFERQDSRCACPEDGLVVRENNSVHEYRSSPAESLFAPQSPYRRIAAGMRECLQFGQTGPLSQPEPYCSIR